MTFEKESCCQSWLGLIVRVLSSGLLRWYRSCPYISQRKFQIKGITSWEIHSGSGEISDCTISTSDGAIRSLNSSYVVVVVSCCAADLSGEFVSIVISESTRSVCGEETRRDVLAFILETFVRKEFAKD